MSPQADSEPPDEDKDAGSEAASTPQAPNKSLSKLQFFSICVAQLNEATQITLPYTVAVYMVRDFQRQRSRNQSDEQSIGRLTGLLAACFCAAQFISSFPWGRVSDRVGRKPMLIMSNLSSCISVIGFGLSTDFVTAAIFRLAGGFFNCTFVCLKSMIGESCDTASQARPLSYLSLCWGLGTVIGPSLGGLLSRPCDTFGHHFPMCRQGQLLEARPFFLPCFVVGLVSFIALLSSLLVMEETLPRIAAKRRYAALAHNDEDPVSKAERSVSRLPETELARLVKTDPLQPGTPESDMEQALEVHEPGSDRTARITSPFEETLGSDPSKATTQEWDQRLGEGQEEAAGVLRRNDTALQMSGQIPLGKLKLGKYGTDGNLAILEEREGLLARTGTATPLGPHTPMAGFAPREGYGSSASEQLLANQLAKVAAESECGVVWYKDKQVQLTVFGYTMICLLYNLMDEVTPIYGSAAQADGGLGLSTSALALPLALGGLSIFVWSMFFYPMYQEYFGVLNACRLGILMTMPLCLGISLPSFLPVDTLALQLILAGVLCLKNIMATNSFTSAVIMVNACAPLRDMGAVNGASQAAASFVRAVGPALGGLLWSLSVAIPVRGHQLLAFGCTAIGFMAPLIMYKFLSISSLAHVKKPSNMAAH